jgi:hypothetical protein
MITTTQKLIEGVNVEFRHYNDRAGTVLWRINHKGKTTGWDEFVNDEWVTTIVLRHKNPEPHKGLGGSFTL